MDKIEYKQIHAKLRICHGPAKERTCVDCLDVAKDWSHIHDTDPFDIDNYEPRCRKCHKKYDITDEMCETIVKNLPLLKGSDKKKKKIQESDVVEIRNLYETYKYTQTELAKRFRISQATVHQIVNRKTWTHI